MAQIEVQAPQDSEQRYKIFAQQWLDKTIYDGPRLGRFDEYRKLAFENYNFLGWQWPKADFFAIIYNQELTYQQFDTLLQILSMTTAKQMGMTMDEYKAYHDELDAMAEDFGGAKDDADVELNRQFSEMESVVDNNTPTFEADIVTED